MKYSIKFLETDGTPLRGGVPIELLGDGEEPRMCQYGCRRHCSFRSRPGAVPEACREGSATEYAARIQLIWHSFLITVQSFPGCLPRAVFEKLDIG